jgi:hypothetical protein
VPVLQDHIGLRGLLAVAGGSAVLGFAVTALLPEPAGRTLEELSGEHQSPRTALAENATLSNGTLVAEAGGA